MYNLEDIYDEDFFKDIEETFEEVDKYLEDLYDSELYRDASLFYFKKTKENGS